MRARILEEKRVKSSTRSVVFVHGSYEVGNKKKNVAAAKRLAEEGIASTVLYESSRNWTQCECAQTTADWIAAFKGKTYQHELADLLEVLEHVRNEHNTREIYLSGTSYGAGLALLAGDQLPITRLLLSAPQITPPDHYNGPIYEGFPLGKKFEAVLRRFAGSLTVVIGNQDSRERWNDAHFIIDKAATRRKTLSVLHAEHNFGDGGSEPEDITARCIYAEEHVRAFR